MLALASPTAAAQAPSPDFIIGTDTLEEKEIAALRPHLVRLLANGAVREPVRVTEGPVSATLVVIADERDDAGRLCREVSLSWIKGRNLAERLIIFCSANPGWKAVRNELQRDLVTSYARRLLADAKERGGGPAPMPDPVVASRGGPELLSLLPPADAGSGLRPRPAIEVSPADELRPLPAAQLAERLERATVLVIADNSIGTGFFIDATRIVTNRHVVDSSKDGTVILVSQTLHRPLGGKIVRSTPDGPVGSLDLALIELQEGRAPGHLPLATAAPKLAAVVASGYPSLVIRDDADFRALVQGQIDVAPDLNLTSGGIQSVQSNAAGVRVIVHTAAVLKGNSGGPLVDACGRVIGVNTYISIDQAQAGRISYAQVADHVERFLAEAGVPLALDVQGCGLGG
ncbi:MAG: serine protease [Alphaproteobacteria bacterium]